MHVLRIFVLCSLFFACTPDNKPKNSSKFKKNTPEYVAEKWGIGLSTGQYESLGVYCTESAKSFLDFYAGVENQLSEDERIVLNEDFEIKKLTCEIQSNTAYCVFCCDEFGEQDEVELVKINGNWLVDIVIDDSTDIELDFEEMMESVTRKFKESTEDLNAETRAIMDSLLNEIPK